MDAIDDDWFRVDVEGVRAGALYKYVLPDGSAIPDPLLHPTTAPRTHANDTGSSLAMYDPGEGAVDRLWDDLRGRLIAAGFDELPVTPGGSEDIEASWLDSNLLLAQTCGYSVARADDRAKRLEDLRGRRAACNAVHSQSGYNAFREMVSAYAEKRRLLLQPAAIRRRCNR